MTKAELIERLKLYTDDANIVIRDSAHEEDTYITDIRLRAETNTIVLDTSFFY